MAENTLYYGDNLEILHKYIPDKSVDLIYLDPPFNSNATYNVLFKEPSGELSTAQLRAFSDTWHWDLSAESTFREVVEGPLPQVARMLSALREFIGANDMMAYLVMMTPRLVELRRVLKPTGSLYLHCDATASHYLKIVMDTIFDPKNFRNEIIWKRRPGMSSAVHSSNRFGTITDTILLYAKSAETRFTPQYNRDDPDYQRYVEENFTMVDEHGRRFQATSLTNPAYRPNLIYEYKGYKAPRNGWMITKEKMAAWDSEGRIYFPKDKTGRLRRKSYADELKGMPIQNLWTDIQVISSHAAERLGYPTQKPEALLERIITASSAPGDVILDPFCGCGTAVVAAHNLKRRWIGIDLTHLAITVMKKRLADQFGLSPQSDYGVIGEPKDMTGAQALAEQDRYQFQWWALSLVGASPVSDERKKGADRGIDGVMTFVEAGGRAKLVLVSVKSGHINASQVRDLRGAMEREKADLGLFVTLEPPTGPMRAEAASAGLYQSELWRADFPRIQICTVEELLEGRQPALPRSATGAFQQAPRARPKAAQAPLI